MNNLFKFFILSVFSLFLLFSIYSFAFASENWIIDNFQSQINIQTDGKVEVIENIDVNFGTLRKHGIFRDIPYIYYSDNGSNIYTNVEIESVTSSGNATPVREFKTGNYIRLQIGDANKTISGKVSYQIRYLATGVLRSFKDHDELYWDVTGNGWPVPIANISATVNLPQNGTVGTACFEGVINSQEKCIAKILSQNQTTFQSTRLLNSSEGMTIVLGYTKGMVPILTVTPPSTSTDTFDNFNTSFVHGPKPWVFLTSLTAGVGFILFWWTKKGKESVQEAIMVEYFAPDKLRPAEVGTLLDERADTLDVSATIIDLAVRGFLTIEEKEKKWLFGSTDYIFSRTLKDDFNLLSYESELLDRLFDSGDVVKLSELKNEFYDDLAEVKQELYKDVIDKKYFAKNPESVKGGYMILAIVTIFLSFFLSFIGLFTSSAVFGFGLAMIINGIVLLIFSRSFAKRTAVGQAAFRKILGFKLFMEKVETYKQRFIEKENLFNELLPYAIVFGITEKFAQAFKNLGINPPQPQWYTSNHPFNPIIFSSNINNFSYSLTSAIASQPSRSHSFASSHSGFSSRGSSGGGFGGGGGGSW